MGHKDFETECPVYQAVDGVCLRKMLAMIYIVIIETVWLATIYGHRMFDAFDRAQARLDAQLEDDLDEIREGYWHI
jgi:hypothetical protein